MYFAPPYFKTWLGPVANCNTKKGFSIL